MKLIEVSGRLQEIPQNCNVQFSMVKPDWNESSQTDGPVDYRQTHPWIKCRDFFSDVLLVRDGLKSVAGVWGFEARKDTYSRFVAVRNAPSIVLELNDIIPGVLIFRHDGFDIYSMPPEWMENPVLVSLWTGLVRQANYPVEQWTPDDKEYSFAWAMDNIAEIRGLTERWRAALKSDPPIMLVHNRSGIVSFKKGVLWF